MPCEELVAGCFAGEQAPFALDDVARERALKYLQCCYENSMTWEDVRHQIEAYLVERGCTPAFIATQLQVAREKLQPWLD